MEIEPVGELTPAEIKAFKETITIPIIAYHYKTGNAKTTKVEFRKQSPLGIDLEVIRGMVTTKIAGDKVLEYIERSLTEKGRTAWEGMLADDDHIVTGGTLGKVYKALVAAQVAPVPTKRRVGSPRTSSATKKTSKGVVKRTPGRRVALENS